MAKGSRLSVAELAGKFTCQTPASTEDEVNKSVRRRPPRTLPLPSRDDGGQGQDEQKAEAGSHPPRKNRNSALIEKLQASLSPTALLPSPLSPGAVKPQLPFFPPHSPCSPVSPTTESKKSQPESPVSFEAPAESTVLLSINKGRARHSIKRRPPSRRHRKSSAEEGETEDEKTTSPVSGPSTSDGKENEVFEEQKVEEQETDTTDTCSAPSEQRQDQEQHEASTDSEQQQHLASTGEEEEECNECAVSVEKEEMVEAEKSSEQSESDSSKDESTKPEPDEETAMEAQSEPPIVVEDKREQEMEKQEDDRGISVL